MIRLAPSMTWLEVLAREINFVRDAVGEQTGSELFQSALNSPLQEPLKIYPVSNLVNSPKTDDPRCIEPAQIDRDMFEKPWWGD